MEYVSVPWSNHSNGEPEGCKTLTVNLALWFVHILAGNHHEVDWDYPALQAEILVTEPCVPVSAPEMSSHGLDRQESNATQETPPQEFGSFSRKRRRSFDVKDVIHHSFSGSQPLATQVLHPLLQSAETKQN
jgi:hypothetical protein